MDRAMMLLLRVFVFMLLWPVRTVWQLGTMPLRVVLKLATVALGVVLIFVGAGLAVISGRPGIPLASIGFALLLNK